MIGNRFPSLPGAAGVRVWLVSACFLLPFAPLIWKRAPPPRAFALPHTPLDRTSPEAADQWSFLWEARPYVLPGASYTVLAPDPDVEFNLYMMSFAVYPREVVRPNSYYGVLLPDSARNAEFVLDFGCLHASVPGVEVQGRVRDGCVERRRSRPK